MDRLAWRVYWWTIAAWVVVLILYVALRQTVESRLLWGIVLSLPLLAAGVNLVLSSGSHERLCAIEVDRHRWLRVITMGGYSRRTFLITGLLAVGLSVLLGVSLAGGRQRKDLPSSMRIHARLAFVFGVLVAACGPVTSHGGPVRDHVSFVDNLRARGLIVDPIGQMMATPFEVPGVVLAVSGGALRGRAAMLSFDYNDADLGRDGRIAAEEDAEEVTQDIRRVRTAPGPVSLPSGPSHFYRKERVIVMYVGDDGEMLRILVELFGPQFAGAR
jgi:hypothetical protein